MKIDAGRVSELKQLSLSPDGNDQLRSLYGVLYGDYPPASMAVDVLVQSIAAREQLWLADLLSRFGMKRGRL